MKQKITKALISTAFHESGHALMNHLLGFGIKEVSIIENKKTKTLGYIQKTIPTFVNVNGEINQKAEGELSKIIMTLYAGISAEKIFSGKNNHIGASDDYDQISELAIHFYGGGDLMDAHIKFLRLKTDRIIRNRVNKLVLCELVEALLDKYTLNGNEISKISKIIEKTKNNLLNYINKQYWFVTETFTN